MSDKPANPRIVLLGAPGAGKSSLLQAFAQTSNQESAALSTKFIDCDGRDVQEYLSGKQSLAEHTPLAQTITAADAIVLAVAPAELKHLEGTLDELTQFLEDFEQQRSRRSDITGLPVYLVLTKCDLLARAGDTGGAWLQRIEEGKHELANRFQEFLHQTNVIPFGQIDLRLWATAIKRPAFTDRPARPLEPYGVAELFTQVVDSAQAFHKQRARAEGRLHKAIAGLVVIIAIMSTVAAEFLLSRPSAEVAALENAINAALAAPAADRLREPLADKSKELVKIQEAPDFPQLPSALQEEIRQAAKELAAYQELSKEFEGLKKVRFFKKDDDIQTFSRQAATIVLPAPYATDWATTRLAKKIEQYQSALPALSKALAGEKDWLQKQTADGDNLLRMAIPGAGSPERQAWIDSADAFLKRKDLTKQVLGVPNMKLRELYEFPSVHALREDYESIRARVDKIRGGLTNS